MSDQNLNNANFEAEDMIPDGPRPVNFLEPLTPMLSVPVPAPISSPAAFVIDDQIRGAGEPGNITIAAKREGARSYISFLYVASFLAIIVLVFIYGFWRRLEINDVKDLLIAVSGILSGPLGFIIGFYFKVEDDER